MTRQQYIVIGLLLVIVAVAVYFFVVNFDLVDEEITTGYTEKAQRDNFLAAERFLKKFDYSEQSHQEQFALDNILKSNQAGTILMSYNAQIEAKDRFENLLNWIKRGGHLILELNANLYPKEGENKVGLLKYFNLSLKKSNLFLEDTNDTPTMVQIYRNGEEFKTDFISSYTIDVESRDYTVKVDDQNGTHLVEFNVGDGSVTFLSDVNIWHNQNIADFDHAALLLEVLGRDPGNIDIITSISMPSLAEVIWNNGKWFCISLLLMLAFYLWSLFEKFGPALEKVDNTRRSLIEHLDAAAKFDWRHFRGATLLQSARSDLNKYLDTKHPSLAQKSDDELHLWIQEKTEIPLDDIKSALGGDTANATRLIHAIQIIQKIRKQL